MAIFNFTMVIHTSTRVMTRIRLVPLIIVLLSVVAFVPSMTQATPQPNFLILFIDDLGYNEINLEEMAPPTGGYGGYGNRTQTPHLAQFAREGLVFTAWYSGWAVCSPSRAAMMTGRLPPRTGIDSVAGGVLMADAVGGLPLNETTFAEILSEHGFATGMIGKWHLGVQDKFLPTNRGFDMYLGVPFSADMGSSIWFPDVSAVRPTPLPLLDGTKSGGWKIIEQPAALSNLTTRYVDRAVHFIQQSVDDGKPFVLYMPFNHVHNPQFCSEQWCGTSVVRGDGPATEAGPSGTGAAVQEMDAAVGRIMAFLKQAHIDNNTLTFFTSDNGAPTNHVAVQTATTGSNSPLSGYKSMFLEGGIRMPAMVRWPGKVPAGKITTELAATYDIFTTMLSIAGAPLPKDRIIDGKDLTSIITGISGAKSKHKCLFHYHAGNDLAAARCGNYKMHFKQPALYDLIADAAELHPLSPTTYPKYDEIVKNIISARDAQLASMIRVVDQVNLGVNPNFAFCGAPKSTKRYPKLPNCTMNPENWNIPSWWPSKPPPPPPMPPSAFVGCFWDKGYPNHGGAEPCDLPHVECGVCPKKKGTQGQHKECGVQTLETCNDLCSGWVYFGVQNGGSGCFCGNTFGRYGPALNCSVACKGNASEICGGPGQNSIYKVTNNATTFADYFGQKKAHV